MSGNVALGPGAEFDAIRSLLEAWGTRAFGIGDDAAVLHVPRGDSLVASVDASVEGRHFRPGWFTPRETGYRAVAAALSDLAAMAARPVGVLVAIAAPPSWRDHLPELAMGIGDAVELARTFVVGGNMSDADELSITTTALGSAFSPLTRSGARIGDSIYVTGRLGGAATALGHLLNNESAGAVRHRLANPVPRLSEAMWLADHGASAAIDISDGLVADTRHLAHASGVCAELDARDVPCVDGVGVDVAIQSGEEYELVVTTSSSFDVDAFVARFGIPLTRIGRVIDGASGVVDVRGSAVANAAGHDHFSR